MGWDFLIFYFHMATCGKTGRRAGRDNSPSGQDSMSELEPAVQQVVRQRPRPVYVDQADET